MGTPRTIIQKVWDNHVVAENEGAPALMYIDLHLVHEVTSPQAFDGLRVLAVAQGGDAAGGGPPVRLRTAWVAVAGCAGACNGA